MRDRNTKTRGTAVGEGFVASCRCGQVAFVATGAPIVGATCYCESCQKAGRCFEQLPAAPAVLDADGGTSFLLYRKDRVRCEKGEGLLRQHRLAPDAPTRRVVAVCCHSPMFLEMRGGHWLSMYRTRFPDGAPPLEMRVLTRSRPDGVELADDLPNYAVHSAKFMWKLFVAWVAMGFRAPAIPYGTTAL
jgi:hypothetical protein